MLFALYKLFIMKKVLFYLLSVVVLLSACSKDDETVDSQAQNIDNPGEPSSSDTTACKVGVFSVSDTSTVVFSPGNLQYQASSGTWRFAPHQWDYIGAPSQDGRNGNKTPNGTIEGSDNALISPTYSGWIDLFGWGTGNNPTQTSVFSSDYVTFYDWGEYCGLGDGWRTLSRDEWLYLRKNRPGKFAFATVSGVKGVILIPNQWETPQGLSYNPYNEPSWKPTWNANVYNDDEWAKMEGEGAIFLPAAGVRNNMAVYDVANYMGYWSSTAGGPDHAFFYAGHQEFDEFGYRLCGHSVRLVK